jgi:hypothetical protein
MAIAGATLARPAAIAAWPAALARAGPRSRAIARPAPGAVSRPMAGTVLARRELAWKELPEPLADLGLGTGLAAGRGGTRRGRHRRGTGAEGGRRRASGRRRTRGRRRSGHGGCGRCCRPGRRGSAGRPIRAGRRSWRQGSSAADQPAILALGGRGVVEDQGQTPARHQRDRGRHPGRAEPAVPGKAVQPAASACGQPRRSAIHGRNGPGRARERASTASSCVSPLRTAGPLRQHAVETVPVTGVPKDPVSTLFPKAQFCRVGRPSGPSGPAVSERPGKPLASSGQAKPPGIYRCALKKLSIFATACSTYSGSS